jgi:hypothetical protein
VTIVNAEIGDVLTWAGERRDVSPNCGEPAFSFFCLTCRQQIPNLYHLGEHLSALPFATHHLARVCRFHDLEAFRLGDLICDTFTVDDVLEAVRGEGLE